MSDRLRIGVVGAGVFGGYHASKYAASENAVLTGVFDPDAARARDLAERFGTRAAASVSALIEKSDAVVIASPATTHFDLACQTLGAGRHVFVEKPLALHPEEADELIAMAEERALILQVGHQERYVAAAFGLLERNLAPIKIDCIRNTASSGRCGDVSVVFDLMIHDFDLVRQLTDSCPERIAAEGGQDETSAEIVLQSGAIASFNASRKAPEVERRMTLVYEDGVIEFDFINREVVNTTPAALRNGFDQADTASPLADPLGYGAECFINAALYGEGVIVTGRHGADAVAWARAVEDAADMNVNNNEIATERRLA